MSDTPAGDGKIGNLFLQCMMSKVTVVGSGLRAITKEHGLTEYWANRITYCTAHPSYPRVFCWIYRYSTHCTLYTVHCTYTLNCTLSPYL